MNQRFASLQQLGEQFERVAESEEQTIDRLGPSPFGGASSHRLRDIRSRLWPALAAGVAVLVAAVATTVVLLSTGAPAAYAGWTAVPASASQSAVATAVRKCYRTPGSPGVVFGRPVLSEMRDRSTAAVFVVGGSVYMCLYNSVLPDVEERSLGPLHVVPGPDLLSLPYGVYAGGGYGRLPKKLFQGMKQRPRSDATALAMQNFRDGAGRGFWAVGRAGTGVSSVTFAFAGHKPVVASIQHGWYFAWWPWAAEPNSVTVTAASATRTSAMGASPHDGLGIRPYPACTLGTSACVFVKTPESPQHGPSGAVVQATRICNQDTLDGNQLPADVFSGRPVLTDHHGVFTGLISITNHRAWLCLQGGYPKNLHRFEVDDIGAFGKVKPPPDPDRLSLPYVQQGGAGEGRLSPPPLMKGETLAQRKRQMLASIPTRSALLRGGGYGPYLLGRAGRQVSSVTLHFANGTTTTAMLQNGWYLLWWPVHNHPTAISLIAGASTITSGVRPTPNLRVPLAPECRPGSQGCVFAQARAAP